MPCYDKKLEAVRPDFGFNAEESKEPVKEIDTVLATHELLELFKAKGIKFNKVEIQSEPLQAFCLDPLSQLVAKSLQTSSFSI